MFTLKIYGAVENDPVVKELKMKHFGLPLGRVTKYQAKLHLDRDYR